jgi:hypothetical protein
MIISVEQRFRGIGEHRFSLLSYRITCFKSGFAAKAHLIGFKRHESLLQFRSVFFSKPDYGAWEGKTRISRKPYQDHSGAGIFIKNSADLPSKQTPTCLPKSILVAS